MKLGLSRKNKDLREPELWLNSDDDNIISGEEKDVKTPYKPDTVK